jgi:hypothetical protein
MRNPNPTRHGARPSRASATATATGSHLSGVVFQQPCVKSLLNAKTLVRRPTSCSCGIYPERKRPL